VGGLPSAGRSASPRPTVLAMGIHDRNYANPDRPDFCGGGGGGGWGGGRPSGLSGISGWSVNTWIIAINVAVFVLDIIMAGRTGNLGPLWQIGFFSTKTAVFEGQVWRFVTFQFLHAGLLHILLNMWVLFMFGPQVEQYLGSRRYLAFYLLSGVAGAALYLLLNLGGNVFPNLPLLLPYRPQTPLVGASAGVFGVLLALAYLRPTDRITLLLFFIIPVSLQIRTLAYGLVAIGLLTVYSGGANAGGEAGHLGGALFGALFIRHPHWLNSALLLPGESARRRGMHAFGESRSGRGSSRPNPFAPRSDGSTSGAERRGRGGGGPGGWFARRAAESRRREAEDKEIERILAKIAGEGLGSLTDKERRTLQAQTDRMRKEDAEFR